MIKEFINYFTIAAGEYSYNVHFFPFWGLGPPRGGVTGRPLGFNGP